MTIEFIAKNYQVDENLRNIIQKKLNRFDKYFENGAKAKVKLANIGDSTCSMEISVINDKLVVRSSATGDKMNEIVDIILPKLERQIVKHRTKLGDRLKKNAFDTPAIYEEAEKDEVSHKVVKVKKFQISVTNVENAIEEMEILNHNFYIFIRS